MYNYGYYPKGAYSTINIPLLTPTSSLFTPLAYIVSEGEGNLGGLYSYACNFSYCPINLYTYTVKGVLIIPPAANSSLSGVPIATVDYDKYYRLYNFTYNRGYYPEGACVLLSSLTSPVGHNSGSSINNGTVVYIDSNI